MHLSYKYQYENHECCTECCVMHYGIFIIISNTTAPCETSASHTTFFHNSIFLATSHHLLKYKFLGPCTTPFINRRLGLHAFLLSWNCETMFLLDIFRLPNFIGAPPFGNLLL